VQIFALVSEIFKSENCVKYAPFRVGQSPAQFLCDRKEYGQLEYKRDTMSSFSQSILQRLNNKEFKVLKEVLKSKRRELRKQVKGNKPNAKVALINGHVERVFEENQFCVH